MGFVPARIPGPDRNDGTMPTLDEALPLIQAAAVDAGGSIIARPDEPEPFGAMAAALLTRQVGSSIGQVVIDALAEQELLDPASLDEAGLPEVQDALRGKVRSISVRTLAPLKHLAHWLVERYDGRAESFTDSGRSTDDLRDELGGIRGVGLVGADAILLAALKRPSYPVDRGTYRILVRHGWLDNSATYDDARELVVHQAGGDPDVLFGLSAGMEELAARFCRASAPRCDACPLRSVLPEGGPLGAQD
jgi:endonuclease III related protein